MSAHVAYRAVVPFVWSSSEDATAAVLRSPSIPQARQVTAPAQGVCGRGDAGLGQLPQSLLVPSCLREGGHAPGCTALARLLGQHVGCSPATCSKPGNEGDQVAEGRVWMDQTLPASHSGVQAATTSQLQGLC